MKQQKVNSNKKVSKRKGSRESQRKRKGKKERDLSESGYENERVREREKEKRKKWGKVKEGPTQNDDVWKFNHKRRKYKRNMKTGKIDESKK